MTGFVRTALSTVLTLALLTGCSDDENGGGGTGPVPTDEVADLHLTKAVSDTFPDPGDQITYTVTVCNDGPDAATGVEVSELFSPGLSYVSHTADGQYDETSSSWEIGTLAPGVDCSGAAVLQLVVRVDATAEVAAAIVNTAQVVSSGADDPDSTPANDDAGEDDQASVTLAVGGVVNEGGFFGDYALARWTKTGITGGTTSIAYPGNSTAVGSFGYDVNLGTTTTGVSQRTATYQMIAPVTGTVRFDWEYTGFHAFFQARANFTAFAGENVSVEVDGATVSSNFRFTGSTVLAVEAGAPFGFELGGRNGDSNSRLVGTLAVSNLVVEAAGTPKTQAAR